jgi:hypothetical protein
MSCRPRTKDVRKSIPLSVKLAVALRMLGLKDEKIQWDHDPALALREWDAKAGDFIPPQLDPNFIVARTKAAHAEKTNGKKATSYGSDKHAIAKLDRLTGETCTGPRQKIAQRADGGWPAKGTRKLQSKGFERRP